MPQGKRTVFETFEAALKSDKFNEKTMTITQESNKNYTLRGNSYFDISPSSELTFVKNICDLYKSDVKEAVKSDCQEKNYFINC